VSDLTTAPVSLDASDFNAMISRLFVYPVKSCAAAQVQEAIITETGLEFDRAWMVVDERGEFLTQREFPRMALICPRLRTYDMVLRAPGMLALHVKLDEVEAAVRVRVWNDEVAAYDMGNVAAQWFTDFLGATARLVRFDPEHKRASSRKWTGEIEALNQFSDGYPVLLITEASLEGFNDRLAAAGHAAVGMERFRPNIVLRDLSGTAELVAHDEDRMSLLKIATGQGVVEFKPVKPCLRCPIPNIDPATALTSPVVTDMLQTYRQDQRVNGAVTFGMNLVVLQGVGQMIKTGQEASGKYLFE
jgi:uncharacterized protein